MEIQDDCDEIEQVNGKGSVPKFKRQDRDGIAAIITNGSQVGKGQVFKVTRKIVGFVETFGFGGVDGAEYFEGFLVPFQFIELHGVRNKRIEGLVTLHCDLYRLTPFAKEIAFRVGLVGI